jgi:hypothetical protein
LPFTLKLKVGTYTPQQISNQRVPILDIQIIVAFWKTKIGVPDPQPLIFYPLQNDEFIPIFISEGTLPSNKTIFPTIMYIVQGSKHAHPPSMYIHSHLYLQIWLC